MAYENEIKLNKLLLLVILIVVRGGNSLSAVFVCLLSIIIKYI